MNLGNYSRLACDIQFVRSMGYYMIQIYIPSSLIVVISWVSFWLNRNASPARVSLGVTTVLTMTTLMSSTNAALPKISYVKSIDIYLGTCFIMVFASLLGQTSASLSFLSASFFFLLFSSFLFSLFSSGLARPPFVAFCLRRRLSVLFDDIVGGEQRLKRRPLFGSVESKAATHIDRRHKLRVFCEHESPDSDRRLPGQLDCRADTLTTKLQ